MSSLTYPAPVMQQQGKDRLKHASARYGKMDSLYFLPSCQDRNSKAFYDESALSSIPISQLPDHVLLTDRTVPLDDRRILETLEAMTRIRRRTGFDCNLVRNKVWAAKISKDLSAGLAKIDRIEHEMKRFEATQERRINAEKSLFLNNLKKLVSARTKRRLFRSQSESYPSCKLIERAHVRMSKSLQNLSGYVHMLENQGGFIAAGAETLKTEKGKRTRYSDDRVHKSKSVETHAASDPSTDDEEPHLGVNSDFFFPYTNSSRSNPRSRSSLPCPPSDDERYRYILPPIRNCAKAFPR
ncbi:unnamed protein product [Clavelina lepadiformis]|uniref:Uncharacterized protein n=1 Tax=Clavelina lepadiformis TaxID=159417 RepID=A0ABP0GSF6_CLALP